MKTIKKFILFNFVKVIVLFLAGCFTEILFYLGADSPPLNADAFYWVWNHGILAVFVYFLVSMPVVFSIDKIFRKSSVTIVIFSWLSVFAALIFWNSFSGFENSIELNVPWTLGEIQLLLYAWIFLMFQASLYFLFRRMRQRYGLACELRPWIRITIDSYRSFVLLVLPAAVYTLFFMLVYQLDQKVYDSLPCFFPLLVIVVGSMVFMNYSVRLILYFISVVKKAENRAEKSSLLNIAAVLQLIVSFVLVGTGILYMLGRLPVKPV